MPHLTVYTSERGKDQLALSYPNGEQGFIRVLEVIVAREFNTRINEDLVPGRTCVCDYSHTSKSIPADICVVILAWWTQNRAQQQELLQLTIQQAISDLFMPSANLDAQVFINIVTRPTNRS